MPDAVCIVCGRVDFTSLDPIKNWVCDECYSEYALNDNDTEWDFSAEKAVGFKQKEYKEELNMANMKVGEYVKQKEFEFGLPQGDTVIDLDLVGVEETTFTTQEGETKPTWKLNFPNGESNNVPKSVMAAIKQLAEKGAKRVRVTRTGTQLATRYTVVEVKVQ